MNPFSITELNGESYKRYPSPCNFLMSIEKLSVDEIAPYLRLHLFEGVPYFLRDNPIVYEMAREWLSHKLDISPRDVFVIGSSSIGFSMAPPPNFGNSYTDKSDIDLAIISSGLFNQLVNSFTDWKRDYESGSVQPQTTEINYWDDNKKTVPKNIARGFIDTYKIPNRKCYVSSDINNSLWQLGEKIRITIEQPAKINVSARIYKDWHSFSKQFQLNFNRTRQKINELCPDGR